MIDLVEGDTRPLSVDLGVPLSGNTVVFTMSVQTTQEVALSGACTVVSPATAKFAWPAGGVPAPGLYYGQWKLTSSQGIETIPNDEYESIRVLNRLE